jgi:hypothetical protein
MTNLIFSEGASPNLSNNWMQKQTVFRTANNTSWIYVGANIWRGYGTFWFDDVELRE